jgi:hypothetical protein
MTSRTSGVFRSGRPSLGVPGGHRSPPETNPLQLALFGLSAGLAVAVWVVFTRWGGNPVDALCYWLTDPANPYDGRTDFQFVYSPAAAQLAAPLLKLPFDVFVAIVRAFEIGSLVLIAGPVAAPAIVIPPVAAELNAANINLVLALVMVLGFRWPALWAIPLLTKPSMGVGLLWFVVRREWRSLAIAVGTAGAIAGLSFALAPRLWFDWVDLLRNGTAQVGLWPFPVPVIYRVPVAVAIVIWGARTNHRWAVTVAAVVALPRLYFLSPAMLVGVLPLIDGIGDRVSWFARRLGGLDSSRATVDSAPKPTVAPAAT